MDNLCRWLSSKAKWWSKNSNKHFRRPKTIQLLTIEFRVTNNEAEYEAIIVRLRISQEMGAEHVELRSDSQVIVGHIQGEFEAKGEKMKLYLSWV
jgi:ribonuclease HI